MRSSELKEAPAYKTETDGLLQKKKEELTAHEAARPQKVAEPQKFDDIQKAAFAEVEALLKDKHTQLAQLATDIRLAREEQRSLTDQLSTAQKLEGRLANIEREAKAHRDETFANFKALGLDVDDAIKLSINKKPLIEKKAVIVASKEVVDAKLATTGPASLITQQAAINDEIDQLKGKLDAPSKAHQSYLQQLAIWEQRKDEIVGSADEPGTVTYYEAALKYITDKLPDDLRLEREAREAVAREIYSGVAGIRDAYAELFAPVQKLIAATVVVKEGFKLSFTNAIIQRGFRRAFFDQFVSQGVNGSFCGKEPGELRLTAILEDIDFDDADQVIAFAKKLEEHLKTDYRSTRKIPMQVGEQLRRHTTVAALYDFLWSFTYLVPEYSLKLDGKDLNLLSPGERGALLLVFYLLVDKSDIPIIVDQPEENLDNQTVFFLLIPVIKAVKERRQIIMVTHNPNIAVVCDAEQVIHASIDRPHGNRITYSSGAIESPTTNKNIVDVLEGTRPAFDNRDGKYQKIQKA